METSRRKPELAIVGIDLGTTNSLIGWADGRPCIASVDGDALLPSVVGVTERGELVVGKQARNQYILRPQETVRSVKRHMGDASWRCALGGREYDAPGVSSLILGHLKQAAEARLGSVTQAVITVPAYFGEAQRRDTAEAGRQAGLDVVRILNEPTAAALLYSTISPLNGKVLVYDLGGGTFDVSVVQLEDGMTEVLASHGNRRLGGDDFDELLARRLAQEFERAHGVRLLDAPVARARVYRAAEEAKVRLSTAGVVGVREEFIAEKDGRPLHLEAEVTRQEFEDLISDLLDSTLVSVRRAIADARCSAADIEQVLLVGGSTRIPAVAERLAEEIGKSPHGEVDPDTVVALGAAVQASIIAGGNVEALLVDVNAHPLGIATFDPSSGDDRFSVVIQRNTAIPTTRSRLFYTLFPDQDTVEVRVYQGEDRDPDRDELLGTFRFEGLTPSPEGDRPREVLVHFNYDLNGLLTVCAEDRPTGRRIEHRIDLATSDAPDHLSVEERSIYRRLIALARHPDVRGEDRANAEHLLRRARQDPDSAWMDEAVEVLYRVDTEY
jgi:molecular chaperone DnaK